MIGLDTNVLVRYITQDDKKQSSKVNRLFEQKLTAREPAFISMIVLVELVWVLESCYQQEKKALISVIDHILATKQLLVERTEVVCKALKLYESSSADFSDALIFQLGCDLGCDKVMTLDKKAVGLGMKLL